MVSFKYIVDGIKTFTIIGLLAFTAFPYYQHFNDISIEQNNSSTVMIANKITKKDPKTGEMDTGAMVGAGILVNDEYIITVNHLAVDPKGDIPNNFKITTIDGGIHDADMSAVADGTIDLMLLKLKSPLKNGVYPTFSCSNPQKLGSVLYTIGAPQGFPRMIQYGNMSMAKIPAGSDFPDPERYVADMAIFHGNSGGPVFDMTTGIVVGIIDAIQYWSDEFGKHPSPISYIESPKDMCSLMDQYKIKYNKA